MRFSEVNIVSLEGTVDEKLSTLVDNYKKELNRLSLSSRTLRKLNKKCKEVLNNFVEINYIAYEEYTKKLKIYNPADALDAWLDVPDEDKERMYKDIENSLEISLRNKINEVEQIKERISLYKKTLKILDREDIILLVRDYKTDIISKIKYNKNEVIIVNDIKIDINYSLTEHKEYDSELIMMYISGCTMQEMSVLLGLHRDNIMLRLAELGFNK